ncbi:MAG: sulfite oxidase, partial [Chloroflexota bacterium]
SLAIPSIRRFGHGEDCKEINIISTDQVTVTPSKATPDRPGLIVVREEPLNAESPLTHQAGVITPNRLFYVRSHYAAPRLTAEEWRLRVEGDVLRPRLLSFEDLLALPTRSLIVTTECAGNGRFAMHPETAGEQWKYGAVSTAEWTGAPLHVVLERAGLGNQVIEILFEGADRGAEERSEPVPAFERSLPLETALHPDTLLAYRMNGEPLSADHGFPVRLIVPRWYGVASVKWLTRIKAITEPFSGYFQSERYVMVHTEGGKTTSTPLTTARVRSVITVPQPEAIVPPGSHLVEGLAWSGLAPVAGVEVSTDGGATWAPAERIGKPSPYAWQQWRFAWQASGTGQATLRSRAVDEAGNGQPTDPEWNHLGYSNNAIQIIPVTIR